MKSYHFDLYGQPFGFHRSKFFGKKDFESPILEAIITKLDVSSDKNSPFVNTDTTQSLHNTEKTATVETTTAVGTIVVAAEGSDATVKQSKRLRFKKWLEKAKSKGFIVDFSKIAAVDSSSNSNLDDYVCSSNDTNTIKAASDNTPNTTTAATNSSKLTDTTPKIITVTTPSISVTRPPLVSGSKREKVKGWFTKIIYGNLQTDSENVALKESVVDDKDANDEVIFVDYFTCSSTDLKDDHFKTVSPPEIHISKRHQLKQWFKGFFIYPQASSDDQNIPDPDLVDEHENVDFKSFDSIFLHGPPSSCSNDDANSFKVKPSFPSIFYTAVTESAPLLFQRLKDWFIRLVFGKGKSRDVDSTEDNDYADKDSDDVDLGVESEISLDVQGQTVLEDNGDITPNNDNTNDNISPDAETEDDDFEEIWVYCFERTLPYKKRVPKRK
ncbi:uncharacterized protein SPAPADRAFT_65146 [Spathaspora passalidarum NRRL Y-27907]|uniref:Uncharacterized protein n=1 Tax=Spathaspora passalidarum (strain NRRL Y-27907 / 11-Y1) TaxID=619300 RepID=G3AJP6_SPAPN|nr:uncharacterized protein SPAPADRAFT_65146 [Spathaspora passalidarum NRRL Y-27907]EGW33947.1 hypothetical protein SPAPADRAFT_65146 [Spathaspora passalidarum NRRL Y-27907]